MEDWIFGVLLITIGSLGNNLGNNLVSLDHAQQREKKEHEVSSSNNDSSEDNHIILINDDVDETNHEKEEDLKPKTSYRVIGTIIFVLGNLFTFASFGFGAQSLLASLESIQFVSNLFFASYIHHEKITGTMIHATLSIVGGNILVVVFADHAAATVTSADMKRLYATNYIYQGYLIIALFLWFFTNSTYLKYYKSRVVDRKPLLWNHSFVEPFCYATSSAIVGTQAVLNSKCLALLIQATLTGTKNEFLDWYIYFILVLWLLLVSYWLNRLDKGLELFPPLFIIPVMQVFFVFFAIICGGLYFEEFLGFSSTQFIGFAAGVLNILSGVYGLAPSDMVLTIPVDSIDSEYAVLERANSDDMPTRPGSADPANNINNNNNQNTPPTATVINGLNGALNTKAVEMKMKPQTVSVFSTAADGINNTPAAAPSEPAHTSTSSVAVISKALHATGGQIHPEGGVVGKENGQCCPVATKKNRKIVKRSTVDVLI